LTWRSLARGKSARPLAPATIQEVLAGIAEVVFRHGFAGGGPAPPHVDRHRLAREGQPGLPEHLPAHQSLLHGKAGDGGCCDSIGAADQRSRARRRPGSALLGTTQGKEPVQDPESRVFRGRGQRYQQASIGEDGERLGQTLAPPARSRREGEKRWKRGGAKEV